MKAKMIAALIVSAVVAMPVFSYTSQPILTSVTLTKAIQKSENNSTKPMATTVDTIKLAKLSCKTGSKCNQQQNK